MHRITKFDIKKQCNEYVDDRIIKIVEEKVNEYNNILLAIENKEYLEYGYTLEQMQELAKEAYLKVLYNVPSGFELTARMTTNYQQLKTIYSQRKSHKLPEWKAFCNWIETLPCAKEFIIGG